MTSLIEKTVAIIAPHRCVGCGNYNNILCTDCRFMIPIYEKPFCLLCARALPHWRLCLDCAPRLVVEQSFVATEYAGLAKKVMHQFKFEHARAAVYPLVYLLDLALPHLNDNWVVTSVPTDPARVRLRSYDQAALLAAEFAAKRGLRMARLIGRRKSSRQVGATRRDRQQQADQLYYAKKADVEGKDILIIDDVCTTGATLQAAAQALLLAKAHKVAIAAVAWQPPRVGASPLVAVQK